MDVTGTTELRVASFGPETWSYSTLLASTAIREKKSRMFNIMLRVLCVSMAMHALGPNSSRHVMPGTEGWRCWYFLLADRPNSGNWPPGMMPSPGMFGLRSTVKAAPKWLLKKWQCCHTGHVTTWMTWPLHTYCALACWLTVHDLLGLFFVLEIKTRCSLFHAVGCISCEPRPCLCKRKGAVISHILNIKKKLPFRFLRSFCRNLFSIEIAVYQLC